MFTKKRRAGKETSSLSIVGNHYQRRRWVWVLLEIIANLELWKNRSCDLSRRRGLTNPEQQLAKVVGNYCWPQLAISFEVMRYLGAHEATFCSHKAEILFKVSRSWSSQYGILCLVKLGNSQDNDFSQDILKLGRLKVCEVAIVMWGAIRVGWSADGTRSFTWATNMEQDFNPCIYTCI